jgi:cyclophilin family peptidyl-prolyl cis-trans isomerase
MNKFIMLITIFYALFIVVSCDNSNKKGDNPSKWQQEISVANPVIVLRTVHGNISIELLPDKAPNSVTRIIQLVERGAYDGIKFHKVIPNFIIQTGDLSEKFPEESSQPLKAEINNTQHIKGTVALARQNGDLNSATTQFYIALTRLPHLDSKYTVFGKVIKGMDVLDKIRPNDKIITLALIK